MPIQHAVLALLAEKPSHGYELKSSFEQAIGPQWGGLNIGHLYQVLDRLLRDGLVTCEVVSQVDRPDKQVYRLSKQGRAELERWMETPFIRTGGYRDDFFLKLFAASRSGPGEVRRVVRAQRKAYLAELASLGELRVRNRDDRLVALLVDAAILHTEANLRVAELAERQAERIARVDQGKVARAAASPARGSRPKPTNGRAASGV
jgi:DNA-binding PadR family transcriptional regulator